MPEMPDVWQHTVNHVLEVVVAFSGLSLALGYGALLLAVPLLLLPVALPELARPRDALWSLVLAALAPLLVWGRLPLFSGAGLSELVATVLLARLAAEVGQGRWGALTADQQTALRHLPRWRRAGADLVAFAVQLAKTAWVATVNSATALWSAVLGAEASTSEPKQKQLAQKPAKKPARKQWIRSDSGDKAPGEPPAEPSADMASSPIPAAVAEPEVEAGEGGPEEGSAPEQPSATELGETTQPIEPPADACR